MTPAKHLCRHINNTFSLCASVFTNLPGNSFSSWRQDEITLCSSSPSIRREFTTFPLMFCGETTQTVTQVSRKSSAAPSWPQLRFTVSLISSTCFRCTRMCSCSVVPSRCPCRCATSGDVRRPSQESL